MIFCQSFFVGMLAAHLLFLLADDSAALQRRRSRQDALKSYYSLADDPAPSSSEHATGTSSTGCCDINGPSFEPDVYLNRLIKERSLTELMDKEAEMVQNIKSLDSDMQTLVYENYNKFISATDTIRTVSQITSMYCYRFTFLCCQLENYCPPNCLFLSVF